MKLNDYMRRLGPERRAGFALDVGTSLGHLNNVAYAQRTASAALTRAIAIQSADQVREWDLRPHDWYRIWPELVSAPGAPAINAIKAADLAR